MNITELLYTLYLFPYGYFVFFNVFNHNLYPVLFGTQLQGLPPEGAASDKTEGSS